MKLLNIIALCLLATSAGAQNVKIIVNNDEKVQRQEVVEVCAKQLYQKMGISYGKCNGKRSLKYAQNNSIRRWASVMVRL